MTTVKDLYNFIDSFAPFDSAMSYDNVGVLVGDMDLEVKKVLLALDITKEVIGEAVLNDCDMIISHHPVIFNPIKNISSRSIPYMLAQNKITALCAHTNLDIAENGVNYCLAKALEMENISPMSEFGFVGNFKTEFNTVKDCARFVKEKLNANGVRFTETNKTINKVAVCSGSGGFAVHEAAVCGADVLITGEIKHNQIMEANEIGIAIIDAGHFKTEDVVIDPLKKLLSENFLDVNFKRSLSCSDKINYV